MKRSRVGILPGGRQPLADLTRVARSAEQAGFRSLWASDGIGDIFSTLTAYAQQTSEILLGAGIAVWHRPPVVTAVAAAQLTELSRDRFILGLGPGPRQWNENLWGIPFERPVGRMREYIQTVRGSMATSPGHPFSFEGDHFQIRGYVRSGGRPLVNLPPVWLGTVGPQMSRLVGQLADGVLFDTYLSPRYLREVAIPAVEAGCAAAGRSRSDVTIAALVPCVVSGDVQTGLRGLKQSLLGQLSMEYFYPIWRDDGVEGEARLARERFENGDMVGALDAISDGFAEKIGVAGPAERCRKQVDRLLELVDEVVLLPPSFRFFDDQFASMRDAIIEAFAVA